MAALVPAPFTSAPPFRAVSFAALLVTLALAAARDAPARDLHLGVIEYELSCLPCHGLDGRGKGPQARTLARRPADLTQLAKSNNGRFPADRVAEMIDGRSSVAAHGPRAMPVWGERYRIRVDPGDTDAYVEKRAREQIEALVAYIRSIQKW